MGNGACGGRDKEMTLVGEVEGTAPYECTIVHIVRHMHTCSWIHPVDMCFEGQFPQHKNEDCCNHQPINAMKRPWK